jgi:glycosyltransferase involved in cell wall biosynthesis
VASRASPGGCRVWIVNQYADAPDRPAGTRHYDLARQLVARGHDVVIFAAGFSNVTHREERLARWRLYRTEWFDGVRFVWLRTFPYRRNTWRRQVNMLTYLAAFLLVQTRFPPAETIIGSTVHPFAALGAWLVARRRGARFLFEVRDLWPQTLVDLGALREGSPGERLLRAIEAFLVRRASFVIALLPGMPDYLQQRGLPTHHVVYIPNGVDLAVFDAVVADDGGVPDSVRGALEAIRVMRAEGRFVVGYVGSFGRVNKLEVIVRAAALAEATAPGRIGLILIGDGAERADLERLASSGGPVALGPAVPRRYVPTILRALDATIVHATSTPVYRYGISFNKLFDYMAAARPVVFACDSAYDPVAAVGAGISIRPDDPQLVAEACLELADAGPERRARMGAAGREHLVREHDLERLGETLATVVSCSRP